jgi:hypothetical protein
MTEETMSYDEQVETAKAKFLAAIPDHPEILTTKDVCELPAETRALVHGLGLSGQQAQFALSAAQAESPKGDELLAMCAELRDVKERVDVHAAALELAKAQKKELALELAKMFRKSGVQSTKLNGRTFSLRTDLRLWKKGEVEQPEICDALEALPDWKEYAVRQYAPMPMVAYVRELLAELKPGTDPLSVLPESIRSLFHAERTPTVTVTKR